MARQRQDRFTGAISTISILMAVLRLPMTCTVDAVTWTVGDDFGTWTIPATSNDLNYTTWADARNFRYGDELYFSYSNTTHSLLLVTASSFERCGLLDPIQMYTSGQDRIALDVPGVRDYYFICGKPTMCFLQQKLHITLVGDVPDVPPSPSLSIPSDSGAPFIPFHAAQSLVSSLITVSITGFVWQGDGRHRAER